MVVTALYNAALSQLHSSGFFITALAVTNFLSRAFTVKAAADFPTSIPPAFKNRVTKLILAATALSFSTCVLTTTVAAVLLTDGVVIDVPHCAI